MKIIISGSMHFSQKMLEVSRILKEQGHQPIVSAFAQGMIGKTKEEIEKLKVQQKLNNDAVREFWDFMQDADAILVLNYDKNGVKNYIGGNTLIEIGFAYVLNLKIFLLNPIPDMAYCKSEIEAMKPAIINNDLSKIRQQ